MTVGSVAVEILRGTLWPLNTIMHAIATDAALAANHPALSRLGYPSEKARWRQRTRVIPVAALVVFVAQCVWFIGTQSLTIDEPFHIRFGLRSLRLGEIAIDDPPLGRTLMVAPLASAQYEVSTIDPGETSSMTDPSLPYFKNLRPSPMALAWRARLVNVIYGIGLGVALWLCVASLVSPIAANFVVVLYALSPVVISNFSVATIDGAGALGIFCVAWQLVRWVRRPTFANALVLGVAEAAAMTAKFNAVPVVAFVAALALAMDLPTFAQGRIAVRWNPLRWNWTPVIVATACAGLLVWTAYRFHVSELRAGEGVVSLTHPHHLPIVLSLTDNGALLDSTGKQVLTLRSTALQRLVRTAHAVRLPIPAGEFFDGFFRLAQFYRAGGSNYFFGRYSHRGNPLYFPVAMALKWPVIVVVLLLLSAGAYAHSRCWSAELVVLMLPAIIFLVLALRSNINIGVRHVLPLYPFALVFIAGAWREVRTRRWMVPTLAAVLLLAAVDCFRYAPDFLSYFPPGIETADAYKLLTDSNLDWNQGMLAVRNYQREHPAEVIHLACFSRVDPAEYGIRYTPLRPGERPEGTVIVSATEMSGQYLADHGSFQWLWSYRLKAVLNHSLYVFEVSP